MAKKLTIVSACDWQAVYVGNELFAQDTQVIEANGLQELLDALEANVEVVILAEEISLNEFDVLEAWVSENAAFPETLAELKKLLT